MLYKRSMRTKCTSECNGKRLKALIAERSARGRLVSIVIFAFQDREKLRQIISNILPRWAHDVELIVIDGGSDYATVGLKARALVRHLPAIDSGRIFDAFSNRRGKCVMIGVSNITSVLHASRVER
jgi:hypothetical protein